jgi:putative sigma-54 modulation protein
MKIISKAKNLEMSVALESFINEKVGSLEKFIDGEVFVEVEKETEHHKKGKIFNCQLEMPLPGKTLVAEADSEDLYKAIVEAKEELEQEIKKYKFKKVEKDRRIQRKSKPEINI